MAVIEGRAGVVSNGGSARYESAANESAKEAWPGSTLAAAKNLKLLSLEPGIIWPGRRQEQR